MSEFFIYAWANFSWYGNPTQTNILGVHWDMAKQGEILEYLAVNTTENSTTLWNYRQRECAFWTEYLPTVIGYITPTYPPTTEFWWEPDSPLQIGNKIHALKKYDQFTLKGNRTFTCLAHRKEPFLNG